MEIDSLVEKIAADACLKYGQEPGLAYTVGVLRQSLSDVINFGDSGEEVLKRLRSFAEKEA